MSTWVLVIIFSNMFNFQISHNGFSIPGFSSKEACMAALHQIDPPNARSTCVRMPQ